MHFRYKVLVANIIILSLAIGCIGYFLIHQNFTMVIKNEQDNAVLQNNLIQSNVEYELLTIINGKHDISEISSSLPDIGRKINSGIMSAEVGFSIYFNKLLCYQSEDDTPPEELFNNLNIGSKHIITKHINDKYLMYITSKNVIQNADLYVVTKTDITEAFSLVQNQLSFFRIMLIFVLFFCSLLMYIISRMLTKPLEQLNAISQSLSKGNYDIRATENGHDEIAELGSNFNKMAVSIKSHVEELNQMLLQKEQFVADFTHELKTPMTSIIGYADTLRSKRLSEEQTIMAANYIFSEGKRLETMSRKLFDLIYLSKNEIDNQKIYTTQLAQEVVDSITPLLKEKSILLKEFISYEIIKGDKDLLKTVFINIIDNARKASPEGGEIIFSGEPLDNTHYQFVVEDYGIGMSKEAVNKVCDEFYMEDKSRSRKEGGAGLGLSLASVIIQKHNGKLSIDSAVGEGTKVTVILEVWEKSQ